MTSTSNRPAQRTVPSNNGPSVLWPALQVGALTGTAGVIVGGTAGLLRNTPAALFAAGSGVQWFALGTTYWGTRTLVLQAWGNDKTPLPSQDRASASAIAGGVAGAGVGLLTRGPRNAIPGGIMFSLFGYAGQTLYSALDTQQVAAATAIEQGSARKQNFWQRLAAMKYSPVAILTDAEYGDMLREKVLRLDAEIALIDESIDDLRRLPVSSTSQEQDG